MKKSMKAKKLYVLGLICLVLMFGMGFTDSASAECSDPMTIETTSPLSPAAVATKYEAQLRVSSGGYDRVWRVISGSLPPGLSMDQHGLIAGTPKTAANYSFIAEVTEGCERRTETFGGSYTTPERRSKSKQFSVAVKGQSVADIKSQIASGQEDFTRQKLTGASFQNQKLIGVRFTFTDLSNADLTGAIIQDADFTNANLTGADFWRAKLTNVNFTNANCDRARFDQAQLRNVTFSGTSMQNAAFGPHYQDQSLDLHGNNLAGARILVGDPLKQVNLDGANLAGANFGQSLITTTTTTFNNANLNNSKLTGNYSNASFNNANLSNSNLSATNFASASFLNANLLGADLSGANMTGADMRGARINKKWTQLIGKAGVKNFDKIIWVP